MTRTLRTPVTTSRIVQRFKGSIALRLLLAFLPPLTLWKLHGPDNRTRVFQHLGASQVPEALVRVDVQAERRSHASLDVVWASDAR